MCGVSLLLCFSVYKSSISVRENPSPYCSDVVVYYIVNLKNNNVEHHYYVVSVSVPSAAHKNIGLQQSLYTILL